MKMLKEKVNQTYYISQMMLKDGDFYPMEDLNPLKKKITATNASMGDVFPRNPRC